MKNASNPQSKNSFHPTRTYNNRVPKTYGLQLGGSRRFGIIESTMWFTLKLVDAVVLECECLTSAQHIFSTFATWEKHAEVIMQVINDLCKEY